MSFGTAYSVKKRAKKRMAEGGEADTSTTGNKTKTGGSNPGGASTGGAGTVTITTGDKPPKNISVSNVGGKTAARNAGGMDPGDEDEDADLKMAEGGYVEKEKASGYADHEGNDVKRDAAAMAEDARRLNQHGEIEEGPQGGMYAEGGQITDNYQSPDKMLDMVGRIIAQHQRMYSKGGKVANSDEITAGFEPNEFDDLHLRDDLEEHYTGANSGDELGDKRVHDDMTDRVMLKRKKDRMPRPA